MRNAYRIMVGTPEGKRPLWQPWHKRGNNIKRDVKNRAHGSVVG
jgi:hypothetical protein